MIYIDKNLYPFVAAKTYDELNELLINGPLSPFLLERVRLWREKLKKDKMCLENHPDGETRYTICLLTGLPAHCEICNEFPVLPDLYAKYKGKLLVYRGSDYESVFDAEESGGVYASTMSYFNEEHQETVITAGMMDTLNILNYAIGAKGMVWGYMKPKNQFFQINDPVTLEKKL